MNKSLKNISAQKLPELGKLRGFLLGCGIGFFIPLILIIYGSNSNPLFMMTAIFLPFTTLACGIVGLITGGSYSQMKKICEKNKRMNSSRNIWLLYVIHIVFLLGLSALSVKALILLLAFSG